MACSFGEGIIIMAVGAGLGIIGYAVAQAVKKGTLQVPRLTFSPAAAAAGKGKGRKRPANVNVKRRSQLRGTGTVVRRGGTELVVRRGAVG